MEHGALSARRAGLERQLRLQLEVQAEDSSGVCPSGGKAFASRMVV